MKPTDRPDLATDRPAPSDLSGTDYSASHRQLLANCLGITLPDRTYLLIQICLVLTTLHHRDSLPANRPRTNIRNRTDLQICLAPTPFLAWTLTLKVISDQDPDTTVTEPDQTLSEEQNYRETMRGIRLYMGWSRIPDMDNTTSSAEDNPFAGRKSQPSGKVSVCLLMTGYVIR